MIVTRRTTLRRIMRRVDSARVASIAPRSARSTHGDNVAYPRRDDWK